MIQVHSHGPNDKVMADATSSSIGVKYPTKVNPVQNEKRIHRPYFRTRLASLPPFIGAASSLTLALRSPSIFSSIQRKISV